MTKLKRLTLQDICLHDLNGARDDDGTSALHFIERCDGKLAYENSAFESFGARAEDLNAIRSRFKR